MISVQITVNGTHYEAQVDDRTLLVEFLRENCRLTGTHVACDTSQCGACTVNLNGDAVKSCTVLLAQANGSVIQTIEGLVEHGVLHPVQEAFRTCHGLQCGFCTPGMIMAVERFLSDVGDAPISDDAVCKALEGNICRCTGYVNIIAATKHAHKTLIQRRHRERCAGGGEQ